MRFEVTGQSNRVRWKCLHGLASCCMSEDATSALFLDCQLGQNALAGSHDDRLLLCVGGIAKVLCASMLYIGFQLSM